MPGISRKFLDTAGGVLINPPYQDTEHLQDFCFCEGLPIAVDGQAVTSHGLSPHNTAVMLTSSDVVFINNSGVIRAGDIATCGDTATGSIVVFSA